MKEIKVQSKYYNLTEPFSYTRLLNLQGTPEIDLMQIQSERPPYEIALSNNYFILVLYNVYRTYTLGYMDTIG